ncbi:MAG: hypothetical protein MUF83_01905 [Acidimicrobiales bacterium]|jgi:protein-tyrosine phosphatase|nr:hypothetical protein [Acidimicrobiales bacterium]
MVEALLRRDLDAVGVPAAVSSAGTLDGDRPATDEVVELMAKRGLDVSGHRSRPITPELLNGSDLVLGMAREHVREAVVLAPAVLGRSFTLKELVRRGRDLGPRPRDEPLAAWLARAAENRPPTAHLGRSAFDDVADPMGQRFAVYKRTAKELEALTAELVDLLWGDDGTNP